MCDESHVSLDDAYRLASHLTNLKKTGLRVIHCVLKLKSPATWDSHVSMVIILK